MSTVDDVREAIISALNEARSAVDDMERNGPGIIRSGAEWIVWGLHLPPGLDTIAENEIIRICTAALNDFVAHMRDAITTLKVVTEFLGSPDNLRAAAEALGGIGTNAHTLSEEVSKEVLLAANPSNWSENYAYSVAIDKQPQSVALVKTYTDVMGGALGDLADNIESFYEQAAGVIVGGALAYVGIAGAAVGVALCFTGAGAIAGLPMAIFGAISAIGGIVMAIISLVNMLNGSMRTINNQIGALEGAVTDDAGADTWHQPVLS